MNYKKWLLRAGFVVVLFLSLLVIRNILCFKSPHGINQMTAFYHQPKNTIDVLAVGSSHVHCDINTAELWEKYGIAAYDLSAAEQPLWMTYHYLLEAYKYQNPEVVLLDVFSTARFKEDYHYHWLEESVHGMKFSGNKLQMLQVSVEPEHYREYFPSFLTYHNRYIDLNKEDMYNVFGNHSEKSAYKGFTPGFVVADQSEPFGGWDELENYDLTEKSEEYLRKICELTKERGSRLIVIVVPYNLDKRDQTTYRQISDILQEYDVPFVDYNAYLDEIGIDKATDFNDHTHLNYWGSVKFSDYLGEELKGLNILEDRRGLKGYKSWDENVQVIKREAEERQK